MGVTLDLRLIDHERIAVRGLNAVNDAIRNQNPEILRDYLATLPVEVRPSLIDFHERRLSKLRALKAPEIIIENEELFVGMAKGEPYRPRAFATATLDELRHLLGTWCWLTHSFSLDKVWDELHWFLEPIAGPDEFLLSPYPFAKVGDTNLTVFTKSLMGSTHYPKDDLGEPIIHTCGSRQDGCSGYNPPEACREILSALSAVNPASWDAQVPFWCELYRRANPTSDHEDIASRAQDELDSARGAFPILVSAYTRAVELGWGVSCEYSL
jgi:hypothetical protein